ncbi:PH domain-containing protein [Patescibacteria group bacterium]|nr:PH domain-containing protein [Patescibacteria group bacterium]
MFENKLRKMLKAEESVVLIVRKYPLVFFWPITFSALFIIAPFFFLLPLFQMGTLGIIIFFVTLLVGFFLSARALVVYSFNTFIITEQRIIDVDQKGLFDRTVSETTYDKIQDVSTRVKGLMQTALHFGSVIIQTAGTQANIELHGVKDPEMIQQSIIEIQREFGQHNAITSKDVAEIIEAVKDAAHKKKSAIDDE